MTVLLLRLTTLVAGLVLLGAALVGAGSTATATAAAPAVVASASTAGSASDAGAATAANAADAPAALALDASCATCEVPAPVLLLVLLAVVAVLAVGIHRLVLRAMGPRAPAAAPRDLPLDRRALAARRRPAAPSLSSLSVLRV